MTIPIDSSSHNKYMLDPNEIETYEKKFDWSLVLFIIIMTIIVATFIIGEIYLKSIN